MLTRVKVVKHLAEEAAVQEKLRESILQAFPSAWANGQVPNLDEITKANIPYLDAFIQEFLRVAGSVSFIAKETLCDMNILGHPIKKGTTLMLAATGSTYTQAGAVVDERIRSESSQKHLGVPGDWGDSEFPAEKLVPERWLRTHPETGEAVFNSKAGPFMGFSTGPRACWGKRLGLLQLKLNTILFMWHFRFEKLPPTLHDWAVVDHVFTKPKNCYVRLMNIRDSVSV